MTDRDRNRNRRDEDEEDDRPARRIVRPPIKRLSLAGSDFEARPSNKWQANVLLCGAAGSKKTTFPLEYCPEPILLLNHDGRDGPAVRRAQEELGREVYPVHINLPARLNAMDPDKAKVHGKAALERFFKNYEWGIEKGIKGEVGTIVIDTATELTMVMAAALCGRTMAPNNDYGRTKGRINGMWLADIFGLAREGKAHLVVLSRAKEIWVDNKPTGYFEPRCPETVFDEADWVGNIRLKRKPSGGLTKDTEIVLTKAGGDLADISRTFTARDWEEDGPFAYICERQFPGSEVEDWMTIRKGGRR